MWLMLEGFSVFPFFHALALQFPLETDQFINELWS